jgi:nucleoside-diphosphate-sugar epimerase
MHLETRVIVTGGAGFSGSHLCERLLKNGAKSFASITISPALAAISIASSITTTSS